VRKLRAKVVEAMITPTSIKVRQPLPTILGCAPTLDEAIEMALRLQGEEAKR